MNLRILLIHNAWSFCAVAKFPYSNLTNIFICPPDVNVTSSRIAQVFGYLHAGRGSLIEKDVVRNVFEELCWDKLTFFEWGRWHQREVYELVSQPLIPGWSDDCRILCKLHRIRCSWKLRKDKKYSDNRVSVEKELGTSCPSSSSPVIQFFPSFPFCRTPCLPFRNRNAFQLQSFLIVCLHYIIRSCHSRRAEKQRFDL